MKSRVQYICLMICVSSLVSATNSGAQMINNKLNIYAGYSIGLSGGKEYINNGSFRFPSLYANLTYSAISIQGLYNVNKFVSAGLRAEVMNGSTWDLSAADVYDGAKASFTFISPVIQVHNTFHESGFFNRLKLNVNVQPIFGKASVSIQRPLAEIEYEGIRMFETRLSDKANTFGFSAGVGFELTLNPSAGVYTLYSYTQHWLESPLYMDSSIKLSKVEFGLYFRFLKNKRYYY